MTPFSYTDDLDRTTGYGYGAGELTTREEERRSCSRTPSPLCTGIYSSSGLDLMKILYYIVIRPNPTVDLGPVDASCALVLCDVSLPDDPIVYVSDAYLALTQYARHEVLGRNCRFLQWPPQAAAKLADKDYSSACHSDSGAGPRSFVDPDIREAMRSAVSQDKEIRVEVPNFQRNGHLFVNELTIVPVPAFWDEVDGRERRQHRYSVGFLCDQATLV